MNEVLTQTNNICGVSSVAEHANACEMLLVYIRNNLLPCCIYYTHEILFKTIFNVNVILC